MARKTVLITGATGYIASQVLPTIQGVYDTVLIGAHTADSWGRRIEGAIPADLLASDRASYQRYFEGADAVVHLAVKRRHGRVRQTGDEPSDPPVLPGTLSSPPEDMDDFPRLNATN